MGAIMVLHKMFRTGGRSGRFFAAGAPNTNGARQIWLCVRPWIETTSHSSSSAKEVRASAWFTDDAMPWMSALQMSSRTWTDD